MTSPQILAVLGGLLAGMTVTALLTMYVRAVARVEAAYVAAATPYEEPETPPADRLQDREHAAP